MAGRRMVYTYRMNEIIQKHLKRTASEAYWLGAIAGLVLGIGLGVMIGLGW
jgi:formate/nitrite transporter FocA (FNT family)